MILKASIEIYIELNLVLIHYGCALLESLTDGCCAAALCHAGIALRFDCFVAAGTPWPVALDIPLAFSVVAALLGSGADGVTDGFGASEPGMLTPGTPATMLPLACPIAPE